MFRSIKDKIKAVLGFKDKTTMEIVHNISIKEIDEVKPVCLVKVQELYRDNNNDQLKRKLRKIVKCTKTYRIRKKNIKRLMSLF